jgi:hypothetical protein
MRKDKVYIIAFFLAVIFCLSFRVFAYDAKNARNPFIPLLTSDGRLIKTESSVSTEGISLQGVVYDKGGASYALVNGGVVRVGDKVGDYQVLRVEEDRVIFIKDGQPLAIEVTKEED